MNKIKWVNEISKKILIALLAVLLVFGCVFIPNDFAYAKTAIGPTIYEQQRDMLLNPANPQYDQTTWFKDYQTGYDPYGNKTGSNFMLTEQDELAFLVHQKKDDAVYDNIYGNYKNGNTGKFEDQFSDNDKSNFTKDMPDAVKRMDAAHMVSFSTYRNENPQKDHIGIIGYYYNIPNVPNAICLAVYNATDNKWSDVLPIGEFSWIDDDGKTYYGDMEPNLSITAGDYNKDNIDTLVCYFANHKSDKYGVGEYKVTDDSSGKPKIEFLEKDSKFNLLNQGFAGDEGKHMDEIYKTSSHKAAGKGSLRARLETGDFNGDNIDDVAVLSALEFAQSDEAKKCDWHLDVPYLAVCAGNTSGNFLQNAPMFSAYVGEVDETKHTADTVNLENFTVARLGKHSCDSIIVGGTNKQFSGKADSNGNVLLDSTNTTKNIAMARYDFDGRSSMVKKAFTTTCFNESGKNTETITAKAFSLDGNYSWNYAWNPISAGTVYMNGKGNDPYILMDGNLYHWKEGKDTPQRVWNFTQLNSKDGYASSAEVGQSFCATAGTCAGVFDGNTQGYEQIVLSLIRKENHSDDYWSSQVTIGIKSDMHDPETGLPTCVTTAPGQEFDFGYDTSGLFYSQNDSDISKYNIKNKGGTRDHGLSVALCNMDYKDDGLCANFEDMGLIYTDPIVECILQCAPYYDCTGKEGSTDYNKTFTISKEISESNEITEEQGYSVSKNWHGLIFNKQSNLKSGSIQSFGTEFSKKLSKKWELQPGAKSDNCVTVSRFPFVYYNYKTYDNENKKWNDDMSVTYQRYDKKITAYFNVNDYNRFVTVYNDVLDQATSSQNNDAGPVYKMTPIEKQVKKDGEVVVDNTDLLENEGNPSKYKNADVYKDYAIFDAENVNGHGMHLSFNQEIGLETSNSWEKSYGTHFNYEQTQGIGLSTKWFSGGRNKTVYEDTKEMWGSGQKNSAGYSYKWTWFINACPDGHIIFDAAPAKWDSSIPQGYDKDGNPTGYVPVYGYLTKGAWKSEEPPADDPGIGDKTNFDEEIAAPDQIIAAEENLLDVLNNQSNETSGSAVINDNTGNKSTETDVTKGVLGVTGPQKAFADETQDKCLSITWNTNGLSENNKYQIYTVIDGNIVKFGNPVQGNKLIIDPNNIPDNFKDVVQQMKNLDLPIYQFAVSSINANGKEGPLSSWVYLASSKYFKEGVAVCVKRNSVKDDNRLTLFVKRHDQDLKEIKLDSISLRRLGNDKFSFIMSNAWGETKNYELQTNGNNQYSFNDVKLVKEDGSECLYSVTFVNKDNSNDTRNVTVRCMDGRLPHERQIEAEILNNWASVDEVKSAIDNPETRDETISKLDDISNEIQSVTGTQLTSNAYDIYAAGVDSINKNSGNGDLTQVIIVAVVAVVAVVALIVLVIVCFKKRRKIDARK